MAAADDGIEFTHDCDSTFGMFACEAAFDTGNAPACRIRNAKFIHGFLDFGGCLRFFVTQFRFIEYGRSE